MYRGVKEGRAKYRALGDARQSEGPNRKGTAGGNKRRLKQKISKKAIEGVLYYEN